MVCADIAGIVFASTAANHLGLVSAAESICGMRLPVVNCCKCLTFWTVMAYMISCGHGIIAALAISFLCAYMAIWLELIMGIADKIYDRIYDKIYTADTDDAPATADDETGTGGKVSVLQEHCENGQTDEGKIRSRKMEFNK